MYPEYDAYTYPSKCSHRFIDYSSERRDWERERERERAPLDLFSRTLSRRILGRFIRVIVVGREKFTFLFRLIRENRIKTKSISILERAKSRRKKVRFL